MHPWTGHCIEKFKTAAMGSGILECLVLDLMSMKWNPRSSSSLCLFSLDTLKSSHFWSNEGHSSKPVPVHFWSTLRSNTEKHWNLNLKISVAGGLGLRVWGLTLSPKPWTQYALVRAQAREQGCRKVTLVSSWSLLCWGCKGIVAIVAIELLLLMLVSLFFL